MPVQLKTDHEKQQFDAKIRPQFAGPARWGGYLLTGAGAIGCVSAAADLLLTQSLDLFGWLVATAITATGVIMLTSYEGITIDRPGRRYRNYTWLLGWRSGEWQRLPPLTRVTLTPYTATQTYANGIAPGITVRESGQYRVLLSVQNSAVGIIAAIRPKAQAEQQAAYLSDILDIPVG
jgi:hypothetical protein